MYDSQPYYNPCLKSPSLFHVLKDYVNSVPKDRRTRRPKISVMSAIHEMAEQSAGSLAGRAVMNVIIPKAIKRRIEVNHDTIHDVLSHAESLDEKVVKPLIGKMLENRMFRKYASKPDEIYDAIAGYFSKNIYSCSQAK